MSDNRTCGVYLLTHIATGRCYVGQSNDVERRLREHATGRSGAGHLANAIASHGWAAFDARVIERCEPGALDATERKWIAALRTLHPNGFNLTSGGGRFTFTEEARRRISERTRMAMTPALCASRAAKLRGVPKAKEHKEKIAAAARSPDNVARLVAFARNQCQDTRDKIAAKKRGKPLSAETRAKISASKVGIKLGPQSELARKKKSIAALARWASQQGASK